MNKPLHTYRPGEVTRGSLVLGDQALVVGQLMCVRLTCWIVSLDAPRQLAALQSGFRVQLPGLGAYVERSAMARCTNGPVFATVPWVEIQGRILPDLTGAGLAEIAAVSSVILSNGEVSDTVEISALQQMPDRLQEELDFYQDRPEMQAALLERFQRERQI